MVLESPKERVELAAASAADDAGFVGLHDLVTASNAAQLAEQYRLIGGHMVTIHAARWDLSLYRETQDADLGVASAALGSSDIIEQLEALDYRRIRPNRWERRLADLPVDVDGTEACPPMASVRPPSGYPQMPATPLSRNRSLAPGL